MGPLAVNVKKIHNSLLISLLILIVCCSLCTIFVFSPLWAMKKQMYSEGYENTARNPAALFSIMNPATFGRTCTPHEIELFVALSPHIKSNCPNMTDIVKYLSDTSESLAPVVIYAGCNKGDSFINTLKVWSRNEKYSIESMYKVLKDQPVAYSCGKESEVLLDSVKQKTLPVKGYCIEPMHSTIKLLQSMFKVLGYEKPEVNLVHAAASNQPGQAEFPNVSAGVENLGLRDAATGKYNTTTVRVITLDDLVRDEQISKIDYLSIDTEGNDMRVVLGAIRLLSAHAIRFFVFEHGLSWNTSSLQTLVELVDSIGYDCYWTVNSGKLARLTGCWSDAYLHKTWSNVACISRKDEKAHSFFESLSALSIPIINV
jgi:FkbM family methyltransferase